MAGITYKHLKDQLASMLGASEAADLPDVDQDRLGICINQAYRECYAPVDGKRPMWAQKNYVLKFKREQQSAELPPEVIDVDKIPELVGLGPLSPMTGPEDQIRIRSIYSHDFKSPSGRGLNFPNFEYEKPEIQRPIWYYIDTRNTGDDGKVVPRLHLYPIPDKNYEVSLYANIVPEELEFPYDEPRMPSDLVWDILYPMAQGRMLSDPRYNGSNRELILRAAEEAKKRLTSHGTAQKHKGSLRLVKRPGW